MKNHCTWNYAAARGKKLSFNVLASESAGPARWASSKMIRIFSLICQAENNNRNQSPLNIKENFSHFKHIDFCLHWVEVSKGWMRMYWRRPNGKWIQFRKCLPINTHHHQIRRRRRWKCGAAIVVFTLYAVLSTLLVTEYYHLNDEYFLFVFLYPLVLCTLAFVQAFPWDGDIYGQLQTDTAFWM